MLVSVVMSVYNSVDFLSDSIESILNQTYSDFEFIIIDDGSNDDSLNVIEKYAAVDSRVVLIQNSINIGLASSLNKGILLAKGIYIARQDADDISALNRLELQLGYALEHNEVDIVGSNCFIIDIANETVYEDKIYSKNTRFFEKLLNRQAIFPHGSALIKKSKIIECGMYDSRFYYVQDGELWLRAISFNALIHVMFQSLYYYRVTPVSNLRRKPAKRMFNEVLQMIYMEKQDPSLVDKELDKIKDYLSASPRQTKFNFMADYWKSLANSTYVNRSPWWKSLRYVIKAVKENKSLMKYPQYFMLPILYFLPVDCVNFLPNRFFIRKSLK
jgi:glycosyltransferase involved in cell wall biosynthesis